MPTSMWFVAGAIGGISTGYLAARRFLVARPAVRPAHVIPSQVRRAPTHPAQTRPALYDWEQAGTA